MATLLRSRFQQTLHRTGAALLERARSLPALARSELLAQQTFEEVERRFPRLENLWLGLRAAAGAPGGPRAVERQQAVQRVALLELSQASDWRTRASAAVSLSISQLSTRTPAHEQVVHGLTQALRDPSAEVAVCAADALGNLADARAVAALREVMENREGYFSALTRAAAVRALSRCLPDAELAFVFAAVRDVQPEVSLAAIATVLLRAREAALFHLLPVLRDNSGYFASEVRLAALQGLRALAVLSPALEAELG
jgi:HEAT repeat protein